MANLDQARALLKDMEARAAAVGMDWIYDDKGLLLQISSDGRLFDGEGYSISTVSAMTVCFKVLDGEAQRAPQ